MVGFIFDKYCAKHSEIIIIVVPLQMMKQMYLFLAAMLLLCLAPMPYGYYSLVRFVAMVVFCVAAYKYHQAENEKMAWSFVALALLFQPFMKIALGRLLWNIVDVVVAIGLIVLFIWEYKRK